jgi:hypothetical protein
MTNEQLSDLYFLTENVSGRRVALPIHKATQEDWAILQSVIVDLGEVVLELNSKLSDSSWADPSNRDALLEQVRNDAIISGKSAQYLGILKSISDEICLYGGSGPRFQPRRMFELRTLSANRSLDALSYDIFVSYKTDRYADQASRLARALTKRGYRVWFDKYVLDRMENRPDIFESDYLLSVLENGVKNSKCIAIFEAVKHAVVVPPRTTEDELVAKRRARRNKQGDLVSWDWQQVEIDAAHQGIAIHPGKIVAFKTQDAVVTWTHSYGYANERQLVSRIEAALPSFGIEHRSWFARLLRAQSFRQTCA